MFSSITWSKNIHRSKLHHGILERGNKETNKQKQKWNVLYSHGNGVTYIESKSLTSCKLIKTPQNYEEISLSFDEVNKTMQKTSGVKLSHHFPLSKHNQMIFIPAGMYLLKVNNRNTRTRCEICSKLTINTPERRHWRRFGVFIVNFEHISHLVLVFLLLTLNK